MRTLSLFSGIGGMDIGFEQEGFEIVGQCEIDPLYRAVLGRHWPNIRQYADIKELGSWVNDILYESPPEVIIGGFPCQPFSVAGSRRGTDDDRWLWPYFAEAVYDFHPRYVVIENVPGLRTDNHGETFRSILRDLDKRGYDALWSTVSAAALGFPHKRVRLFVVAYPHGLLGDARDFKPEEVWGQISPVQDVAETADWALASFAYDGREADGAAGGMAVAGGLTARMVEAGGNAVIPLMARGVARIVRQLDSLVV